MPTDSGKKGDRAGYEFGGPLGVTGIMLGLPVGAIYLWLCNDIFAGQLHIPTSLDGVVDILSHFPAPTKDAAILYIGWFLFQALLEIVCPGEHVQGTKLADGTRLTYHMNGWFAFHTTWVTAVLLSYFGIVKLTVIVDNFGPLISTTCLFSLCFSIFLYLHGKFIGKPERMTGNFVYDFFMGPCINPRIGSFDFKCFCESRPGLILWVLVDWSIAAKQYELTGAVSPEMLLVCGFHTFYILDYFWQEDAILTTMDIMYDKFGFMLCFGDLVWVPFTYSLQAYYLLVNPEHSLPWWGLLGCVALNFGGYSLFRMVNNQKHNFRTNPDALIWGKKPEFVQTKRGTKLLVSGFWGMSRHMNYTGDWLMGLAWCLPCGFGSVLPYYYAIYFAILLIHRERRDYLNCQQKYGKDWDVYCKRVPYRMIPKVF